MNDAKTAGPRTQPTHRAPHRLAQLMDLILRHFANAPSAWIAPADLAHDLRESLETVHDALTELDLLGMLVVWEQPDRVCVTLSRKAAQIQKLQLAPATGPQPLRWQPINPPNIAHVPHSSENLHSTQTPGSLRNRPLQGRVARDRGSNESNRERFQESFTNLSKHRPGARSMTGVPRA